ncbi:MAG: lipid-binding SYLF domain-containing protein [Verrucomicrobia bacterium]|nr:lipid-binding SYLF domain-containing protein [Verrucomicrobiota bacterium]
MHALRPLLYALLAIFVTLPAHAETARELRNRSEKALHHLYANNHKAREIGDKAIAVLVFPDVYKAGFMVGAQTGNGVLFKDGRVSGYYNSSAASYGLQAGIQKFSYALFFMDEHSLHYLNKSGGFEVGGAPSLVVADEGFSSSLSTTTLQKGIYAFFFGQKGLMAGIGLQGTKISQYHPSE